VIGFEHTLESGLVVVVEGRYERAERNMPHEPDYPEGFLVESVTDLDGSVVGVAPAAGFIIRRRAFLYTIWRQGNASGHTRGGRDSQRHG